MPKFENVFVPHKACTVASGDCFSVGKCLGNCQKAQKKDHESRIKRLETRIRDLEIMVNKLISDKLK